MGKSQIRNEITALLHDFNLDSQAKTISAKFAFPPAFSGFSGHFPNNPILPGICQIQCALVLISKYLEKDVCLSFVKRVKFLNTVVPEDEILVEGVIIEHTDDSIVGDFIIKKTNQQEKVVVSRMKIQGV